MGGDLITQVTSGSDGAWHGPWLAALCAAACRDAAAIVRQEGAAGWEPVAAFGPLPEHTPTAPELTPLPPSGYHLWLPPDGAGAATAGLVALGGLRLALDEQAQASERQRAASDHFFGVVSHDLKAPLAGIKAIADLIGWRIARGKLDPATDAGQAELATRLGALGTRVTQMAQLLDQLGDLGRIERGRLLLDMAQSELGTIARAAVEQFEARHERAVTLQPSQEPLPVGGDARRLIAVVLALLSNAANASSPDSPISVRLARVGGSARLSVTDEGSGIAPEQRARLFRQYGPPVQAQQSGLGIGLYVASAVVRAHGGTLALDSEPGRGTAATLTLPLLESQD